jgi:PD-(D/E)XK nuclease superfamily
MLIKGFFCPCVGRTVAPDHYSSGSCKNPPMMIGWILGALGKEAGDLVHRDNNMSASRLAHCFRKAAIEDNIPSVIDVRELDTLADGTAKHEFIEKYAPASIQAEVEFPKEGKPRPVLWEGTEYEITMRGRVDVLQMGGIVLEDLKTTGEWSQKFRWERRTADPEWNVQASIYKILAKKCEGIDIQRAVVWSAARVGKKSKAPAWFQIPITFMSEREILDVRPLDGEYTVGDNILAYKTLVADLAAGVSAEEAVRKVPMFGKTTKRFSECDYCIVAGACRDLAGEVSW